MKSPFKIIWFFSLAIFIVSNSVDVGDFNGVKTHQSIYKYKYKYE